MVQKRKKQGWGIGYTGFRWRAGTLQVASASMPEAANMRVALEMYKNEGLKNIIVEARMKG